ncbi:hypothetical protein [Streptomyces hirsutus]|uniref:hypothetical protein n=1 Tax=Streptomyces hirsutus TaxID=35620 RepID=UPI0036B5F594
MRRILTAFGAALTAAALLLTVSSCSGGHDQGPAGQVVAKESDYECKTTGKKSRRSCRWEYELTTRDRHGDTHEFEVSSDVYDKCRHGSAYPACINR